MHSWSARRRGVGQQGHLAAVLHGHGDVTLVLAAVAADAARTDLAAVGDELPQQGRVLVVDVGRLVLAELADLLLRLWQGGAGVGGCHRIGTGGGPLDGPRPGGSEAWGARGSLLRRAVRRRTPAEWT